MSLGLRELREEAGLTQKEVSKHLDYKYASGYNQIENGKRDLNFDAAKALAVLFNKSLEEIYYAYQVVKMNTNGICDKQNDSLAS